MQHVRSIGRHARELARGVGRESHKRAGLRAHIPVVGVWQQLAPHPDHSLDVLHVSRRAEHQRF